MKKGRNPVEIYWWYSQGFTRTGTNLKGAKISIEITLALHHCDLCDFAGTHDFLADDFLQTCYQDILAQ